MINIEKANPVLDYLNKKDAPNEYFVKDCSYTDNVTDSTVTLFEIHQKKKVGSNLVARLEKSKRFGGAHTVSFVSAILPNAKLRELLVDW